MPAPAPGPGLQAPSRLPRAAEPSAPSLTPATFHAAAPSSQKSGGTRRGAPRPRPAPGDSELPGEAPTERELDLDGAPFPPQPGCLESRTGEATRRVLDPTFWRRSAHPFGGHRFLSPAPPQPGLLSDPGRHPPGAVAQVRGLQGAESKERGGPPAAGRASGAALSAGRVQSTFFKLRTTGTKSIS